MSKTPRAADQAPAKTEAMAARTRNRVRYEVDRRATSAGERAGNAAQALRDASRRLNEEGKERAARR